MINETIGEQHRPKVTIYMNGREWGTRNWSVIPRIGEYITIMYRHKRHDTPKPIPCLIDMITWDEADIPLGAPVKQLVHIYAKWPNGILEPDLS